MEDEEERVNRRYKNEEGLEITPSIDQTKSGIYLEVKNDEREGEKGE